MIVLDAWLTLAWLLRGPELNDADRVLDLLQRERITVPAPAYVQLASRIQAKSATLDQPMRASARRLGVALLPA